MPSLLTSGISKSACPTANSKIARALSMSPRIVSNSAYYHKIIIYTTVNIRNFIYINSNVPIFPPRLDVQRKT